MSNDRPTRGSVGNEIFDEVERLVASGMNKSQAFKEISTTSGREEGTVAANYYRVARQRGVSLRPRRRRGEAPVRGRANGTTDVAAALATATAALDELAKAVRRQDQELARLREESNGLAELRRLAKRLK